MTREIVCLMDAGSFKMAKNYLLNEVNCQGKMGSGVAKAIRDKYPKVYETYLNTCAYNLSNGNSPEHLGGEIDFVKINDNKEVV